LMIWWFENDFFFILWEETSANRTRYLKANLMKR